MANEGQGRVRVRVCMDYIGQCNVDEHWVHWTLIGRVSAEE